MSKKTICFVDDEEEWYTSMKDFLGDSFEIQYLKPPPLDSIPDIVKKSPDAFMIDFRLLDVFYGGTTLAGVIRSAMESGIDEKSTTTEERPIIILTQFQYVKTMRDRMRLLDDMDDIHYIQYKDELLNAKTMNHEIEIINGLIAGFEKLRKIEIEKRTVSLFLNELKIPNDSGHLIEIILNSNPPFSSFWLSQTKQSKKKKDITSEPTSEPAWTVHDFAKWMIGTLFRYPGVLYDDLHVATSLGISLDSWTDSGIQNEFKDSLYKGVYHGVANYWWRDVLHDIAYDCILKHDLEPDLAHSTLAAFSEDYTLTPSKCIYSHEPSASLVCYFLEEPVKQEHAVLYLPDDRPRTMDPAYVSRLAYEEIDDVNIDLIPKQELLRIKEEGWM